MKITKPNITAGPWYHGYKGPYLIAATRPPERTTKETVVTYGNPTGGFGWPDSRDPENEYGLTPEAMEANAKAIAALPELLDIVIEFLEYGETFDRRDRAKELLVKAGCTIEP